MRYPQEVISEDVLELFEEAGASNELFEWWQALTLRLDAGDPCDVTPLPPSVRNVAVQCIERMAKEIGSSWNSFFLGVAIFDAVCTRRGVSVEATPAVCAAVAGLVKKEDDATACVSYEALARQASQFAQWLRNNGHPTVAETVTVDEIHGHERDILDSLGWIVQLPTIQSWVNAMVNRLHVLTRGRYASAIQMIWQTSLVPRMKLLVLRQGASPELSMREAACGLFGVGLQGARLLPAALDAVLAPELQAQPPLLGAEESDLLLRHLAMACGSDVVGVQVACEKVAGLMRQDVTADARSRQPAATTRVSV